ncbi:MAG TPA: hypothetical protein VHX88_09000 [Solirubrobacteraceae bacterium]|nr:hypothetical protein [Solirubrobacteraceae bacterium]
MSATLRGQLATLERRLGAGDLAAAGSAWLAAHLSWLALGQGDGAYGAFGNLGNEIDGTAAGDVGTTSSPSFTGSSSTSGGATTSPAPAPTQRP